MTPPTTSAVRYRPILFSGEMVRAILAGRKTQTRRVITPQLEPREPGRWLVPEDGARFGEPDHWLFDERWEDERGRHGVFITDRRKLYRPGDRLWVREAWAPDDSMGVIYRADYDGGEWTNADGSLAPSGWKPSIHMRREHSRITLEITGVRVERVNEITREDAIAEGIWSAVEHDRSIQDLAASTGIVEGRREVGPADYFRELWDRINAGRGYGWDANPWVWVITVRRIEEAAHV